MSGDDHSEPVVFGPALEGLIKALGPKFTPQLRETLARDGIDLSRVQVAYSLATWLKAIRTIADALGSDVPTSERYRHLGHQFMRGFVETPIGYAALTASKVFGVKRTLLRMGRNFKTAANYIDSEMADLGPKEISIRTYVPEKFFPKMQQSSELLVEYRGRLAGGARGARCFRNGGGRESRPPASRLHVPNQLVLKARVPATTAR